MSFIRALKRYHLACLGLFSPKSVVAQMMKSPLELGIVWPEPAKPRGAKLLERKFTLAGSTVDMSHIDWNTERGDEAWMCEFYSFEWLSELAHSNEPAKAASMAREFIGRFITEHQDIPAIAWEHDIAGARLCEWLNHRQFLLKGANKRFVSAMGKSIIRHVKQLNDALRHTPSQCGFPVHYGMLAATSAIPDMRFMREHIMRELPPRIKADIFPDGCHISACPKEHLMTLRYMLNIKRLLTEHDSALPVVDAAIASMAEVLDFFRHGDKRLSLFGGGLLSEKNQILTVLQTAQYDIPVTPISYELAESGFARVQKSGVVIIVKTADRAATDYQGNPCYRDALAFELSDESERFIVNCGEFLGSNPMWQDVMRRAAAHSTLSSEDRPSKTTTALPTAERPSARPALIDNNESGTWSCDIQSQQIYDEQGIYHQRVLEFNENGDTLSGSDTIFNHRNPEHDAPAACLRFHLHPDIRCKRDGEHHIKLTAVSGTTWTFSVESHEAVIEESVYLGYYGAPQKTLQIVVRPVIRADRMTIDWTLSKESVREG